MVLWKGRAADKLRTLRLGTASGLGLGAEATLLSQSCEPRL